MLAFRSDADEGAIGVQEDHTITEGLMGFGMGVAQQETTDRMPANRARLVVGGFGLLFGLTGAAIKLLGPRGKAWPEVVGRPLFTGGTLMIGQAATNLVDDEVLHLQLAKSGQEILTEVYQVPAGTTATPTLPTGGEAVASPTFMQEFAFESM